jgi:hypothetical protein
MWPNLWPSGMKTAPGVIPGAVSTGSGDNGSGDSVVAGTGFEPATSGMSSRSLSPPVRAVSWLQASDVQPSDLSRPVPIVRIGSAVFRVQIRGQPIERQLQSPRGLRRVAGNPPYSITVFGVGGSRRASVWGNG